MTPFRARIDGPVSQAWRTALTDIGGTIVEDDAWDLVLPPMGKGLRAAVNELRAEPGRSIGVVRGADALASKKALWWNLMVSLGRTRARRIMPETFLLDDPLERVRADRAHREGDLWVLKHPHRQAREGVRLLSHPRESEHWLLQGWTVLQRFIPDVLLRKGHRFHVRRYVVVVVADGYVRSYLADFGKCIYAPEAFGEEPSEASSIHRGTKTWAGPPDVPQTWAELLAELEAEGRDPGQLETDIRRGLLECVRGAVPRLTPAHLERCRLFQLFGADIVIDDHLHPWVLELNKRPEMRPRGLGDGPAKIELLRQTFRLGLGRPTEGLPPLSEHRLPRW